MLDLACMNELPRSCVARGQITLASGPRSQAREREAVLGFVRGCDLGDREGCEAAAPLIASLKLFPKLRPFAVKWGQWTQYDDGQLTAWVTTSPAREEGMLVREFSAANPPKGVVPPPGADKIYAVADKHALLQTDTECSSCQPSGKPASDVMFSMRSRSCVCALAPLPASPAGQRPE
jgi:hypothetical protein